MDLSLPSVFCAPARPYCITFSACPFVIPSVRPFVTKLDTIFWKRMNRFCCKLAQVVRGQRHETVNFEDQEVKVQGHTKSIIDIKAWWMHKLLNISLFTRQLVETTVDSKKQHINLTALNREDKHSTRTLNRATKIAKSIFLVDLLRFALFRDVNWFQTILIFHIVGLCSQFDISFVCIGMFTFRLPTCRLLFIFFSHTYVTFQSSLQRWQTSTRSSAVADTARRFVSLNILLSHPRLFELTLLNRTWP